MERSRGASMGLNALVRVAGIASALRTRSGRAGPGNLTGPPIPGRHPCKAIDTGRGGGLEPIAHDAVFQVVGAGPIARAAGWRSLPGRGLHQRGRPPLPRSGQEAAVLWLDAHADFNTNTLTPSGNLRDAGGLLVWHRPRRL